MTRTYELGFVVEPRQSDEDIKTLTAKYREMIEGAGAEITFEDHWGKRKLAYPIEKYTEGKYVFLYITANGTVPPFTEIERLMGQNDKVLRFLTVRTDEDIKRAMRKGKVKPHIPGQEEEAAAEEAAAGEETPAAAESAVDEKSAAAAEPAAVEEPTTAEEPAAVEEPAAAVEPAAIEEPAADEPAKKTDESQES